jgi:cob(I)alamin adenosyltransferase
MSDTHKENSENQIGIAVDETIVESKPHILDDGLLMAAADEIASLEYKLASLDIGAGPFDDDDSDLSAFTTSVKAAYPSPKTITSNLEEGISSSDQDNSDDEKSASSLVSGVQAAQDLDAMLEGDSTLAQDVDPVAEDVLFDELLKETSTQEVPVMEDAGDFATLPDLEETSGASGDELTPETLSDFDEPVSEEVQSDLLAPSESDFSQSSSLFSALFQGGGGASEVTDQGVEDPGIPGVPLDETNVETDLEKEHEMLPDEDFIPLDVSLHDDGYKPKSLLGSCNEGMSEDEYDHMIGFGSDTDKNSQDSSSFEDDHLPQLVMGGDDAFSIPGSDYTYDTSSQSEDHGEEDTTFYEEENIMSDKDPEQELADLMGESSGGSQKDPEDLSDILADMDDATDDAAKSSLDDLIDRAIDSDGSDESLHDIETFYEQDASDDVPGADPALDPSENQMANLFGDTEASEETHLENVEDGDDGELTDTSEETAAEDVGEETDIAPGQKSKKSLLLSVAAFAVMAIAGGAGFMLMSPSDKMTSPPIQTASKSPSVIVPIGGGDIEPVAADPVSPLSDPEPVSLGDFLTEDVSNTDEQNVEVTDLDNTTDTGMADLSADDPLAGLLASDEDLPDASDLDPNTLVEASPVDLGSLDQSGEVVELPEMEFIPDVSEFELEPDDRLKAIDDFADLVGESEKPNILTEKEIRTLFVEEKRVLELEARIDELSEKLTSATDGLLSISDQIEEIERSQSDAMARMSSTQRQVQGYATVFADFAAIQESLEQTQSVLLDVAGRVSRLENANPASQSKVDRSLNQLRGEIDRLAANMAVLSRMTLDGTAVLESDGKTGAKAVKTSPKAMPKSENDKVFQSNVQSKPGKAKAGKVTSKVKKGDFVEGYGFVLDIVPASGGKKLVIMENGSELVKN